MLKTTLAGLRMHQLRLILTALAIVLGVGFLSGTFVLTDTMKSTFNQEFTRSADKVSVAVLTKDGVNVDVPDSVQEKIGKSLEIPASLLARIKALPGVADAQGIIRGDAALVGRNGKVYGDDAPPMGLSISTGALQRYRLESGHLPTTPHTVVLDDTTARRNGFEVGDTVRVFDHTGRPHTFRVSGLMNFGVDKAVSSRGAVGFSLATAAQMTGRSYVEIDVKTAPGTGAKALRSEVAATAGKSYDVVTSHQLAKRLFSSSSGTSVDRLGLLFQTFALVALFVSALVIYNTFNILIAQRLREMALLRCVGATRGQIFRGVLLESVIVGFAASALGVLAGIGLGVGGAQLFASVENSSLGPIEVSATPVVVGMLAGVAVTLASALLPAYGATRVPPVAALRSQTEGPVKGRASRLRLVVGALLSLAGLASVCLTLASPAGEFGLLTVIASGFAVSIGVVALSPLIIGRLSAVIGWLPARLFGVPGQMARLNAGRNPKRAAITSIALTVGVTLMTMFLVGVSSVEATANKKLTAAYPFDYELTAAGSHGSIPQSVADRLRTVPQMASVVETRQANAELAGHKGRAEVGAVTDGALGNSVNPHVTAGSITGLRPGEVALADEEAVSRGVGVGDTLTMRAPHRTISLRVAGLFEAGTVPIPPIEITEQDFGRAFGAKQATSVSVTAKKGVPADVSRQVVENATKAYPMVKVSNVTDQSGSLKNAVNQMLLLVGALLGLAVIISLIGVANTLSLSVVERTRESALLRALGLTKGGLRWMLLLEAAIMAMIGALMGVALGTLFAWAAASAVIDAGHLALAFPAGQVLAFALAAPLASLLAAIIPSRRATKTSIVASLASG